MDPYTGHIWDEENELFAERLVHLEGPPESIRELQKNVDAGVVARKFAKQLEDMENLRKAKEK